MTKANAAQVLAGFVWKNDFPKDAVHISVNNGVSFDQTKILEYLMGFQTWLFEHQPQDLIDKNSAIEKGKG